MLLCEMDLEEHNLSDLANGDNRASYARSKASERKSEASSLPTSDAQVPGLPGSILAPESINTKVLMARSIALAHTGIGDKNTREADDGHQAMLAARAVCVVVYGLGGGDMVNLRAIMAELGMWVISTRNFCGMGIKDPKEKQWHTYDWGSR
jgi:hypothetical protein